jgi:hypothetical protein
VIAVYARNDPTAQHQAVRSAAVGPACTRDPENCILLKVYAFICSYICLLGVVISLVYELGKLKIDKKVFYKQ